MILIHLVRTLKGAPLEPVGVWCIDGDDGEPLYPPETARYKARGEKALMDRPLQSLEEWARYKEATSSNWSIYRRPSSLFGPGNEPDAREVLRDLRSSHQAKLAHSREAASSIRANSSPEDSHLSAGWGASRYALAQSWWVASELARRHPELVVYEMHPGGGMYDVLCVVSTQGLSSESAPDIPRVMLNRVGTLQVHEAQSAVTVASWADVVDAWSPHSVLKELEMATGWGSPSPTPATTSRVLVYRFVASALTMLMNDRHQWDARSVFLDSSHGCLVKDYLTQFPHAQEDLRATPPLGLPGEPESHFWALQRDSETMLVLSIEGRVYDKSGGTHDIMPIYQAHDRKLIPFTASLLAKWL
ncbi:TY-Chap2 family putative peptide chaperone [Microbacterium sp. A204]|uniref:TY-Chap2 family putative peptide chaperone n=1 Tax=Microbacterium sp. A204 TaxID=3457321 RepID=UPI003FD3EF28